MSERTPANDIQARIFAEAEAERARYDQSLYRVVRSYHDGRPDKVVRRGMSRRRANEFVEATRRDGLNDVFVDTVEVDPVSDTSDYRHEIRALIDLAGQQGRNITALTDTVARQGANFAVLENTVETMAGSITVLTRTVHELAETVRRFFEGRTNGDT